MRECHDPCEIQATHSRRTDTITKKKISPEIELHFLSLQHFSTGIHHVFLHPSSACSLHPSSACHRHILSSGFLCSNVLSLHEFSLGTGRPRASSASASRCIPPTSSPSSPGEGPLVVGRRVRGPGHQESRSIEKKRVSERR